MAIRGQWRVDASKRPGGTYFRLRYGSRDNRKQLGLGYVTREEADTARDYVQSEHDADRLSLLWSWYERDHEGFVEHVVGDPVVAKAALDEFGPDWGRMSLRSYFENSSYQVWRAHQVKSWPTEREYWARILPVLGSVRVRDLDPRDVMDYLDGLRVIRGGRNCSLANEGEPVSGQTKVHHRNAIRALLKYAYRKRHIDALPDLAAIRIKGATTRAKPQVDPLDLDELKALMDASEPKFRAMWGVQAGVGLRPGELVRMRWSDVDLERRVLSVRGTKTTASAAVIGLTPLATKALLAWREVAVPRPTPDGVVFPSRKKGTPYASRGGYKRALAMAAQRAGIERPVTPYLLRATFATIAWAMGVDEDTAVRTGRWTDAAMFRRVYCRPRPQDLAARLDAFDF
ncbi:MAG: tyrosine-type recombinase/integrase [Myxococcota bacterium]